jgi:hypothetical protein
MERMPMWPAASFVLARVDEGYRIRKLGRLSDPVEIKCALCLRCLKLGRLIVQLTIANQIGA